MKINFNFEKRHFYILTLIIVLFVITIFVKGLITNNKPWHSLQEISTTSTGQFSVDADGNGIIDRADDILITQDTNSIKGRSVYWDSTDNNKLCYNLQGTCTTVTATCLAGSGSLTIDAESLACTTCSVACCNCDFACKNTVRCDGNTPDCTGTQVKYTTGLCSKVITGRKCQCSCNLASNTNYNQGTLTGTKKCSTFTDST